MVYIIAIDSDDSTSQVIQWLHKLKKDYLRMSNLIDFKEKVDFFPLKSFDSNSNEDKSDLHSIWIRQFSGFNGINDHNLQCYYWNESKALAEFIFQNQPKRRKVIGVSSFGISINKLEMLSIVKKYQLLIPSTIITNSKDDVLEFHREYKKIITKAISDVFIG